MGVDRYDPVKQARALGDPVVAERSALKRRRKQILNRLHHLGGRIQDLAIEVRYLEGASERGKETSE